MMEAVNCRRLTTVLLWLIFISSLAGRTVAQTISGQVLVITRAHETVKLALVPIEIYRADNVEGAVTAVDTSLQAGRERMANFTAIVDAQNKTAELASDLLSKAARDSFTVPRQNAALRGSN
jgi:hypothetical protein